MKKILHFILCALLCAAALPALGKEKKQTPGQMEIDVKSDYLFIPLSSDSKFPSQTRAPARLSHRTTHCLRSALPIRFGMPRSMSPLTRAKNFFLNSTRKAIIPLISDRAISHIGAIIRATRGGQCSITLRLTVGSTIQTASCILRENGICSISLTRFR